jgi:hypothetical protein
MTMAFVTIMVMMAAAVMRVMMSMDVPVTMLMVMAVVLAVSMVMRRLCQIIRLERRHQLCALQPMLRHQRLDLRPFLQPDPVGEDLHRDVAVAERHEKARGGAEILGEIPGAQLDHSLDVGHDFREAAVIEHQQVVSMQVRRLGKIELDAGALAAEYEALLPAPVVEFQQQCISDLARPGATLVGAIWRPLRWTACRQPHCPDKNFLRPRHHSPASCVSNRSRRQWVFNVRTWRDNSKPHAFERCLAPLGENLFCARRYSPGILRQRPVGRSPPLSNGRTAP